MRTLKVKLYKYDELSDKAKEKAREWYTEGGFEHTWWDSVYEDAKTVLGFMGFSDVEISFSGFWSQGDGASFTGKWRAENVKLDALNEHAPEDKALHDIATRISELALGYTEAVVELKRTTSTNYVHENTVTVSTEDGLLPNLFISDLQRDARAAMRWVYKQLEAEWESINSEESVAETIMANEYDFYGDGARASESRYEENVDLLDIVALALPYVEEAADDPVNKREHVMLLVNRMRAAIEEKKDDPA